MTDELRPTEQDELAAGVRRAFSAYRAPVRDLETAAGGRAVDRRPRLLALSATASVAVVVVAVLVVQSLARPGSAYAGWTAVPRSPDPALGLVATESCRRGMTDPAHPGAGGIFDSVSLPLVAQDQRGDVALALFSDGRSFAGCIVMSTVGGGTTAVGGGEIVGLRSGPLRVLSAAAYEGEPPLRMVIGDVSRETAAVSIERTDSVRITATVTNGYFLAWWPTADGVAAISAYDDQGNSLGTLDEDIFD